MKNKLGRLSFTPITVLLGVAIFLIGITAASVNPYRGILAIDNLGMSNDTFALVLTFGSIAAAIGSVIMGYVSDRVNDRRKLVIGAALAGAIAYGLIFFVQTQLSFIIAVCVFLPFGGAVMSQSLSYARAHLNDTLGPQAEFMMSLLRTLFSVAWIIAPPAAGWIAANQSVFLIFLIAAIAQIGAALTYVVILGRPEGAIPKTAPQPQTSGIAKERALPLSKILGLMGVMGARIAVLGHMTVFPLFMVNDAGGTLGQLGLASGLAAFLEVPLMLAWGYAAMRLRKEGIIVANAVVFAIYLFALGQTQTVVQVFWLQGLNALAISGLLTMIISYTQEAIKGRVGLSTSLLDVMTLIAGFVSAGLIAFLATEEHYAAVISALAFFSLAGAGLLFAGWRLEGKTES